MDSRAFVNRLKTIRELNGRDYNFLNKDLYRLVISEPALVAGYELIKSNKGATTPATELEPRDGFGPVRLGKLISSLRTESWKPKPARRVMIPKPGKSTKRPLSIQGPEDKIVQSALKIVLEAVYEPIFSTFSYGFRPNLGAHDALKNISTKYDNVSFAIEGDIKPIYDNVNHHTLVSLISRKVKDERLISLIWKYLKAGYMEENMFYSSEIGTPQGSIISPLLANIYLHELDMYMLKVIDGYKLKKNPKRVRTPIAKDIKNKRKKFIRKLNKLEKEDERDLALKEDKRLTMQNIQCRTYCDCLTRIYYHRYADDFIIGVAGSMETVEEVKELVRIKLESLSLGLSVCTTKVTNLKKEKARFLGYDIYIGTRKRIKKVHVKGKTPFLRKDTRWSVYLEAPMGNIISKLFVKSFCTRDGFPTPKKIWTVMPDHLIVDAYNVSLGGILQYYSGVCHRHMLGRLKYIFRFSCAMTLATKHRSSVRKILKKHGKDMAIVYGASGEKVMRFKGFNVFKEKDITWHLGKELPDPFKTIHTRLTRTKVYDSCCVCGEPSIGMHHLRHLRKSNPGTFDDLLGVINRKQIPVCLLCHDQIHAGKHDGLTLSSFANPELTII